jgi:Amt family ammonium transporter
VAPLGSIAVGAGVALACYVAITFVKPALGYDDSLDAFGVHGVGGAWGALASGLFAVSLGSGIDSNAEQVMVQLRSIGFTMLFAPALTFAILGTLRLAFGSLRVSEEDEFEGLDVTQHSESAYSLGSGASIGGGAGSPTTAPTAALVDRTA